MKSCPLVSVVMAARNADLEMLDRSITSILGQRFEDIELLIVNDGNPDHILEHLDSVAKRDERVRLIHNECNIGLTRSLIRAIEQAGGRYIARQDADDISAPDRLQLQVNELKRCKELVLVGCWYTVIDESGLENRKMPPKDDKALRKLMFLTNPFCHASVMFRKDAYIKVNGYNADYVTTQDLDLWLRLARIGKVGVVDRFLVKRIVHSGSISVSFTKGLNQVKNGILTRFAHRTILRSSVAIPLLILSASYHTALILLSRVLSGTVSGFIRRVRSIIAL
jgi:glycosyltransferase involved in cell wall biosynthesis